MARADIWMTRAAALAAMLVAATNGAAQSAVQFRSDLRIKDSDGRTGTAKLYVGASKLRMEFQVSGETRPTIIEPRDETQFTISPRQRNYMEMPLGESGGTVRLPRIETMNPDDPCSNDRLSECKRLGSETIDGYAIEKWEYTNVDADRETAWISTKLRFPIRTSIAKGATTEITNVVEGPQPASLFDIPAGYAKVDDIGGGATRDLDPAFMQRAMEAARGMAAQNPALAAGAGGTAAAAPSGPSPYEGGPGWLLTITITVKGSTSLQQQAASTITVNGQEQVGTASIRTRGTSVGRYVASIPLNSGAGPIPTQGPQWFLLAQKGNGSAESNAAPFSFSVDTRSDETREVKDVCSPTSGSFDDISVITQKGSATTTLGRFANEFIGSAIWKLNPATTAYSLTVQVGPAIVPDTVDESQTSKHVDHCGGDKVTNQSTSRKLQVPGVAFEVKDIPLSANLAAGIKGSTSIPWTLLKGATTGTAEWTITRLGAR